MKNEWNPDDWQGRSRQQVEDSEKIQGIILTIGFIALVSLIIYNVIVHGV